MNKIILLIVYFIVGLCDISAQTYLYKRVMIVKNDIKTKKNDDAHYLTFNKKGFYESDENGYKNANNNSFVEFVKDKNNLHCYFGNGYYGTNHYYFSQDYSRLNLKIDNSTTYVYQRENSGSTTAKYRKLIENNNSNTSVSPVFVTAPSNPSAEFSEESHSSTRPSRYTICKECNGTGACKKCKNTGTVFVTGGSVNYVTCPSCNGRARCWRCYGRGRY